MPNHVSTITTFRGNQNNLESINRLLGDDMDFNKVLPMPAILGDSVSPTHIVPDEKADGKQKITQEEAYRRMMECGSLNWYDWKLKNWGTKWGAYDVKCEINNRKLQYRYDTAWSPATPVLLKISSLYPMVKITSEYADEGGGFVCRDIFICGELIHAPYSWDGPKGRYIRRKVQS